MNKDYAKFMRALYGTQDNRDGEQYQKLMAHEKDVLATVNRVANQARRDRTRDAQFVHMSLQAVVRRFSHAMTTLVQDLARARNTRQLMRALKHKDRTMYLGLLLVIVALFLLLLQA